MALSYHLLKSFEQGLPAPGVIFGAMTDLFDRAAERDPTTKPLAERMRPRSLDEVIGQPELLGERSWLRRALKVRTLSSIILWGPPGVGKTTIGRLLAEEMGATFEPLSAVTSGVKDVREAVAAARQRLSLNRRRTLVFVDEIHRFNKGQQDALLPHVESGVIILVGATTENPSFEVNAPLLSRTRVLLLETLSEVDLVELVRRALNDSVRGLGAANVTCSDDALQRLARLAGGDARKALNLLEAALATAEFDARGQRLIDREAVDSAIQHRALVHDKGGDDHYAVASAFIKSLRGSDPDAAVYWMARLLEAGEDPLFVVRRMVVFAGEDIGNADPNALCQAVAAQQAVHLIGMPEAIYPLTQVAVYLAAAPKSNTTLRTYARAREAIKQTGALPVPLSLRNASTGLQKDLGYGRGYKYPHDFGGTVAGASYLPEALAGVRFFEPTGQGAEAQLFSALGPQKQPQKPPTEQPQKQSKP